jgi:hypothetical protein
MSAKDFKFVSPGVFIEEIDNSQLPKVPIAIGPVVIGRSRKGPAFQPVRIDSFSEFVTIFGNPVGGQEGSDKWRFGIPSAPTFAAYAAQAWLKNSSPITFIRLLGDQSPDADSSSDTALAGWKSATRSAGTGGGAYGLFLFNSSSASPEAVDGTLAAVFYTTEGIVTLSGSVRGGNGSDDGSGDSPAMIYGKTSALVYSSDGTYHAQVFDGSSNTAPVLKEKTSFNFSRGSKTYIRKVFNTDPTLTNSNLVDANTNAKTYFLGQTFESEVAQKITSTGQYGIILGLGKTGGTIANGGDFKFAAKGAKTGWVFSQDLRNTAGNTTTPGANTLSPEFNPEDLSTVTRLFKVHSISQGEDSQRNFKVTIEDLKYSRNDATPYGSFSLGIRDIKDTDNARKYVEKYTNLSLDPSSENYIAKQIGDKYYEWDSDQRRLIEYGSYDNRSSIIRVEMASAIDAGTADPELLPFGVEGPLKLTDFTMTNVEDAQAATATVEIEDFEKIRTGLGAVISQGENTANRGVYVKTNTPSSLAGHSISVVLTDVGFKDDSGDALSGTYEIILKNENAAAFASLTAPTAKQVFVNTNDGTAGQSVTAAILATRISEVFKRNTSYSDADYSGTYSQLFTFGADWANLAVAAAGGDLLSVFEASVVNTQGVKIQARGYNGGAHAWGNDGRFGGASLVDVSDWKVNATANLAHTAGDQSSITAGDATGASTITLTTATAAAQTVTVNAITNGFIVGHNKATTGDALQAALNAFTNFSATDNNAGIVTATDTLDTGAAGNSATVSHTLTTAGALKIQGVNNAALAGSSNFTGGDNDNDARNGRITTTAEVLAGTGSSGADSLFIAATGSGATPTGVRLQYEARAEGDVAFTGSVTFPSMQLRLSSSDGDLGDPTDAFFGLSTNRTASSLVFDESVYDLSYPLPSGDPGAPTANVAKTSWYFSLDDLVFKSGTKNIVFYRSGSRADGDSVTARSGSYRDILDRGYDRFTAPLYGGFNGLDILEAEPFNDRNALSAGSTETSSAMFYSVKKSIDMFSDPEFIEGNILVAPGIVNEGLTTHLLTTCEQRGDSLAIIDPRGGYKPASENADSEKDRITPGSGRGGVSQHVVEVGQNLEDRNLNSSYGAVYYPWVRISDTISGKNLWAPPSVAALGAMSFSENNAALWFAPAGFNRGGLSDGAAGIPVTNVRSRLTSAERDFLYERNINPIASFPNEGIVIFGQKTLQVTPSALDRINVRRLMIFVKKEISRIASNLLFDQNVEQTWSRFTGQVGPFLTNIKNNFGLTDFRVILDETTTTPDLIDRNTIYAKIFLKPARAVEFFAIDFVITNSGAGFED